MLRNGKSLLLRQELRERLLHLGREFDPTYLNLSVFYFAVREFSDFFKIFSTVALKQIVEKHICMSGSAFMFDLLHLIKFTS
jgi:hypothetical protein